MSATTSKLSTPLAPLLPRLQWGEPVSALVAGIEDAAQAVQRLEAAGELLEAARLVSHALPRRQAVWWACMCAAAVPDRSRPPTDEAARQAAEAWVRQPGDDRLRRIAWDAAQATDFKSPEAWAATAAFWSGASLAPEGQPVVPPADHLAGVAVAGAVTLASVRTRPERAQARLARFLGSARDIAAGGAGRLAPEND